MAGPHGLLCRSTKDVKWLDWAKEIQAIAQAGLAY
ncbi:NUDIX hydrolase N-terminal domain-containing protein, partial [Bacillus haynesii]